MASTLDITPVVKDSLENKQGILEFTLKNTDVSIVNGLRRTLLTNINSAFKDKKNYKIIGILRDYEGYILTNYLRYSKKKNRENILIIT